jgi:hypothetical protein
MVIQWRKAAVLAAVGVLVAAAPAGATHGGKVYENYDECWETTQLACSKQKDGWHPADTDDLEGAKEFNLWLDPEEARRQENSMPSTTSGTLTSPVVAVDMNQVTFPDAQPYLDQEIGRVRVPIRFISEQMGAKVEWDGAAQTVTIVREGLRIQLTVDQSMAVVNGRTIPIDAPPNLVPPGRVMVPLRFISEAFGAAVDWVGEDHPAYLPQPWGKFQVWIWVPWGFWGKATIEERIKVHQYWFYRARPQ